MFFKIFQILSIFIIFLISFSIKVGFSSTEKNISNLSAKKEKTNLWSKTQNLKKKMFQTDQEDSTHPVNPMIMEVPSLKLKDSPCEIQPNMASVWTKCKW